MDFSDRNRSRTVAGGAAALLTLAASACGSRPMLDEGHDGDATQIAACANALDAPGRFSKVEPPEGLFGDTHPQVVYEVDPHGLSDCQGSPKMLLVAATSAAKKQFPELISSDAVLKHPNGVKLGDEIKEGGHLYVFGNISEF